MSNAHLTIETATAREVNPVATLTSALLVMAALTIIIVVSAIVLR